MADSQVPRGVDALTGSITEPAWRTKPSWYLLATEDRMIPPLAQRFMSERAGATVTEAAGSHSVYRGFRAEANQMAQGAGPAALSDALLDSFCLIGPIERCQDRLAAYRAAGVDLPILNPPIGPDAALTVIRAFRRTAQHGEQPSSEVGRAPAPA